MRWLLSGVLLMALVCGCGPRGREAVTIDAKKTRWAPAHSSGEERNMDVIMPRTWMRAKQALIHAHRQTGMQYAVVPATFETPVPNRAMAYRPDLPVGRLFAPMTTCTAVSVIPRR